MNVKKNRKKYINKPKHTVDSKKLPFIKPALPCNANPFSLVPIKFSIPPLLWRNVFYFSYHHKKRAF